MRHAIAVIALAAAAVAGTASPASAACEGSRVDCAVASVQRAVDCALRLEPPCIYV